MRLPDISRKSGHWPEHAYNASIAITWAKLPIMILLDSISAKA
jgi:hypothetical protein